MIKFTLSRLAATWIFLPVDGYVRDRGFRGDQPRPVGPLRYILVARLRPGGARVDFDRPLVLTTLNNPSGYDLFFDRARPLLDPATNTGAGASGDDFDVLLPVSRPPRRMTLADGSYVLRVISRFYAPVEIVRTIPDPLPTPANPSPRPDPAPIVLTPGPAYPFSAGSTLLRGVELGTGGAGLADVVVSVPAQPGVTTRTGRSGQWVLAFPPTQGSGPVVVRLARPGQLPIDVPVALTAGAEMSLPLTALRGWVQSGGRGVAGAAVEVAGAAPPVLVTVTTGDDGGWAVVFPRSQAAALVDVTATLGGVPQTVNAFPVAPGKTFLVPTFRFN